MGGGGAMRTAAKVAGVGYSPSGFRHLPTVPSSEQAASTARRYSPQVPAISAAGDTISSTNAWIGASVAVQRPLWDDWEFAGDEEAQQRFDAVDPPPRVVFGEVPTMEEAREATMDLKDALEKVYFSSPVVTGTRDSSDVLGLQQSLSMGNLETKACITSESAAIRPVPKPVLSAFFLLKESPEVQNVVASLAADKNVWEAVMKNEKVMNFYKSQQAAGLLPTRMTEDMESSCSEKDCLTGSGRGLDEQTLETPGNGFTRFLDSIKMRVANMVSNLTDILQNIFGNSAEESSSEDTKRDTDEFGGKAIGFASFLALGILAIMVVLLKRN